MGSVPEVGLCAVWDARSGVELEWDGCPVLVLDRAFRQSFGIALVAMDEPIHGDSTRAK